MTPHANLQKRGKRAVKRRWGSGPGRDRDGRRSCSPFPPSGPRPKAARQARGTAAAARSPAGGRGPVFHPRPTPTSGDPRQVMQPAGLLGGLAHRAAQTITAAARSLPTSCEPGQSVGTLARRPASRVQVLKDTARFLTSVPSIPRPRGRGAGWVPHVSHSHKYKHVIKESKFGFRSQEFEAQGSYLFRI